MGRFHRRRATRRAKQKLPDVNNSMNLTAIVFNSLKHLKFTIVDGQSIWTQSGTNVVCVDILSTRVIKAAL